MVWVCDRGGTMGVMKKFLVQTDVLSGFDAGQTVTVTNLRKAGLTDSLIEQQVNLGRLTEVPTPKKEGEADGRSSAR